MTSARTPPAAITLPQQTRSAAVLRFGRPTLADALFLALLCGILLGASSLFSDPGTGWHLRTGNQILATGAVPRADTFSYTRAGHVWVETQWLADVLMFLAFGSGGYSLMALATAILLAGLLRWVYRTQVSNGSWPVIALLVTLLGASAASGHFLARPLVASSVGIPLCFWWATQYARGAVGRRRLWLLVPIATVWCNVHPGVLGGIATVGLCGIGTLAKGLLVRFPVTPPGSGLPLAGRTAGGDAGPTLRAGQLRRGATLLAVGAAMGIATVVNPYGLEWHRWVLRPMGMGLAEYVHEWTPPDWTSSYTIITGVLAAAVIVGTAVRRKATTPAEGLIMLFWLIQATQSRRHLPLAAIILALQLGRVLAAVQVVSPVLRRIGTRVPVFSAGIRHAEVRSRGGLLSVATVALLTALLAAGITVPALGRNDVGPPATEYSAGVVEYLRAHPPAGRFFNTIKYGGTLIHELPGVPVFIDDRFGLYGRRFMDEYLVAGRKPKDHAARLFDRWQIDTALVDRTAPLLWDWLADNPKWTESYRDGIAAIYTRSPRSRGEHP